MFQLKGNGSGSIKVQRVQLIPSQRRLPFPSKVGDATPTNRLKKEPRRFSARISANRVLARRDGRIPRKTTGISCKRRRSSNVLWRLPDSRCLWYGGRRACTLVRTTGGRVAVSCGSATRPKWRSTRGREQANRFLRISPSQFSGGTRCGLTRCPRPPNCDRTRSLRHLWSGCMTQELLLTTTVLSPTPESHEQASQGWNHR